MTVEVKDPDVLKAQEAVIEELEAAISSIRKGEIAPTDVIIIFGGPSPREFDLFSACRDGHKQISLLVLANAFTTSRMLEPKSPRGRGGGH